MVDLLTAEQRRAGYFEKLYKVFYDYFEKQLAKDSTAYSKYRLQLISETFDDLSLYNQISPVFAEASSNPMEKRAVAKAALWDALVAHKFSAFFRGIQDTVELRLQELERNPLVAALDAKLSSAIDSIKRDLREVKSAIPKEQ
jgi:hypothetical protein